jgi:hypothetical protein
MIVAGAQSTQAESLTLLLRLPLARINPLMSDALVNRLHASCSVGPLKIGTKLLDLTVDLSDSIAQDCPPISHYRIVLREQAWLRRWLVKRGDKPAVGDVLALFSTGADEPIEGSGGRSIRVMTAGIVPDVQAGPWAGEST